jgi:hypothetical protein
VRYLVEHWEEIRGQLLSGIYQPKQVREVEIPKGGGGVRKLGIPTVLDRFIQQSILQVLQPMVDPTFSEHSHGFRPGRNKAVFSELRSYLTGWKQYFRLAETPSVFERIDKWIRHRLRMVQLKQWKKGRTVYREMRRLGADDSTSRKGAGKTRCRWKTSRKLIQIVLPTSYYDQEGVPRLAR